jgi:hypothetical protein
MAMANSGALPPAQPQKARQASSVQIQAAQADHSRDTPKALPRNS